MNPSKSKVTSAADAGMPNQDNLNNPRAPHIHGYHNFPKSHRRLTTSRFSDVRPFMAIDAIEGDNVRFGSSHELRTYTLKSPMLSGLRMNKDYFQVPWSSILPNTWEHIYRNPVRGVDIPSELQPRLNLTNFIARFYDLTYTTTWLDGQLSKIFSAGSSAPLYSHLIQIVAPVQVASLLCSNDGVLKSLGCSVPLAKYFDKIFSGLVDSFWNCADPVGPGLKLQLNTSYGSTLSSRVISFSSKSDVFNFLQDFARGQAGDWFGYAFTTLPASLADLKTLWKPLYDAFTEFNTAYASWYAADGSGANNRYIDLKRLVAYQICCAQYFSNSHIDNIYTAKMWHASMLGLVRNFDSTAVIPYEVNGTYVQADCVSSIVLNGGVTGAGTGSPNNAVSYLFNNIAKATSFSNMNWLAPLCGLHYWYNLVAMQASLRFGDYFAESRLQPLAVGDVTTAVDINSNTVSVIDVNHKLWIQRFLNAVNRSSQNIYDYLRQIAGVSPERIEPQPNFIVSQSFEIAGIESDNTGSAQADNAAGSATAQQNLTTTQLRSQQSKFAFECYVDEPSVILGLFSFTAPFIYAHAMDKSFEMADRFDWFNTYLEHIGDQNVMTHELNVDEPVTSIFGYQIRYAQFKKVISHACGGFADPDAQLDSWALIWSPYMNGYQTSLDEVLSTRFLRNHDTDFDRFYSSLSNVALTTRFHFIVSFNNQCEVNSMQEKYPDLI